MQPFLLWKAGLHADVALKSTTCCAVIAVMVFIRAHADMGLLSNPSNGRLRVC